MSDPLRIAMNVERVQQFRDLSKRLKTAGRGDLRKALNKGIKESGKPIVEKVRQAASGLRQETSDGGLAADRLVWIPSSGSSHGGGGSRRRTFDALQAGRRAKKSGKNVRAAIERSARRRTLGLRARVARATALEATARGVRFVVRSAQLPESQRNLPRHLDSEKGWRHPTFGDREKWVQQRSIPAGFFSKTISHDANRFRQGVLAKLEEVKKQIEQ